MCGAAMGVQKADRHRLNTLLAHRPDRQCNVGRIKRYQLAARSLETFGDR